MGKVIINESDMIFGEYESENVFQIEKSDMYTSQMRDNEVKVTEFVLLRDKKLLFLEAKKSTPNYKNCRESEERLKKYNEYIQAICDKFSHSVAMYMSMCLNRLESDEIPKNMLIQKERQFQIVLVLVVKNSFSDSLIHYKEILEKRLKPEMRIWNVNSLIVISEEIAKKKGLAL